MPIMNVKVAALRSPALSHAIAGTLLDLTEQILHKRRDLTAIAIDFVDPADWYVGGHSLASQGQSSFYADIKVTDETNTKAEKAQYIAEVYAAFARLLGDLHEESYLYVEDARAAAWGYGGKTQEYRFHHPA